MTNLRVFQNILLTLNLEIPINFGISGFSVSKMFGKTLRSVICIEPGGHTTLKHGVF